MGSPQDRPERYVDLGPRVHLIVLGGMAGCLGLTACAALGALVVLYRLAGAWGCA